MVSTICISWVIKTMVKPFCLTLQQSKFAWSSWIQGRSYHLRLIVGKGTRNCCLDHQTIVLGTPSARSATKSHLNTSRHFFSFFVLFNLECFKSKGHFLRQSFWQPMGWSWTPWYPDVSLPKGVPVLVTWFDKRISNPQWWFQALVRDWSPGTKVDSAPEYLRSHRYRLH